jgi:phosphatidylglycerophosphate synthase
VHRVHAGPLVGMAGVLALVGALDASIGLGTGAWFVGAVCGAGVMVLLDRSVVRTGRTLGPADQVTLVRAVLVCGVAALVAHDGGGLGWLVGLATVALVLDGVDGWVARRTGTSSAPGARFDMEVDAFLILVLSVQVAGPAGWWVLLIGAARYLLLAAATVLPWLDGTLPSRPWCKVVAVIQGVALITAAADVLAPGLARAVLVVALALLVESFGREVHDLWRLRAVPAATADRDLDRAA